MSTPTLDELAANDTRTNPRQAVEALADVMDAIDAGDLATARYLVSAVANSLIMDVHLSARFELARTNGVAYVTQ